MTTPSPEDVHRAIQNHAEKEANEIVQALAKEWIPEGKITPARIHRCGLSPEISRYAKACLEAVGWDVVVTEIYEGDESNSPIYIFEISVAEKAKLNFKPHKVL